MLEKIFQNMKENLNDKYLIHNLVFYKTSQKYGKKYFSNPMEFIKFCPFDLITKVEINSVDSECIETSMIFKI